MALCCFVLWYCNEHDIQVLLAIVTRTISTRIKKPRLSAWPGWTCPISFNTGCLWQADGHRNTSAANMVGTSCIPYYQSWICKTRDNHSRGSRQQKNETKWIGRSTGEQGRLQTYLTANVSLSLIPMQYSVVASDWTTQRCMSLPP